MNEATQWLKVMARKPEWRRGAPQYVQPPARIALEAPNMLTLHRRLKDDIRLIFVACKEANIELILNANGGLQWVALDKNKKTRLNSQLLKQLEDNHDALVFTLKMLRTQS